MFIPTEDIIFVVVHNRHYYNKRYEDGYGGFADIPEADDDAINVKMGMERLGAKDITDISDASHKDFIDIFSEKTRSKLREEGEKGKKKVVFFYYAGHGVSNNNMTSAVLNEELNFPIQSELYKLAKIPNTYIVAVLDCSRENDPAEKEHLQGKNATFANANIGEEDGSNIIISFGCPPSSSGRPVKSTMSVNYFEHIRE